MKLTIKSNAQSILNSVMNLKYRSLSLPFELEINNIVESVNFMIFRSIPFIENLDNLLEKESFKIMLIDDGTDIEFEKKDSKYLVSSTSNRANKEIVSEDDVKNFIVSFWNDITNLLGEEVVNKVKNEIISSD